MSPGYYYNEKDGCYYYVPEGYCGGGIKINPGFVGSSLNI